MSDLISRADVLEGLKHSTAYLHDDIYTIVNRIPSAETTGALDDAIAKYVADGLMELPSADAVPQSDQYKRGFEDCKRAYEIELARSADAVQGWRIGKPTEQGSYMVTLDSFGHKHIDLFYYGKPLMPNRKVRGKCWYRSDDEWGDVVYDDTDILAWQPLPTPYKGGDDE